MPRVILLRSRGAFCFGESEKRAATAEMLFEDAADIAVYSRSFGGASHMTEELTDFITNWEVEASREARRTAEKTYLRRQSEICFNFREILPVKLEIPTQIS